MKSSKRTAIVFLLLGAMIIVSCLPVVTDEPDPQATLPSAAVTEIEPSPTMTETQQPVPGITPTLCPPATPEPLWVEPVTSPTDSLTQVITVYIGNGEEVSIKTESGTFTVTGEFNSHTQPALVEITLLPNMVHHLEVTAQVKQGLTGPGNCVYEGYILTTLHDKNGAPLIIAQGAATP